jgi:dipeptidyl aminopeptidase/acylaminoacyl peptidase
LNLSINLQEIEIMRKGNAMKKLAHLLIVSIIFGITILSCATAPRHPSLRDAELPDLIPLRHLFVNIDTNFSYKVSPDGKVLAWIAVKNRRLTIFFKTIGKDGIGIINTHSPRSVYWFAWAQDSRQILYSQDQEGNENYHIYLADTDHPDQRPVDLTPFANTRARIHQIIRTDPEHVLISHNRRDKTVFDLHRINLNTREQTLIVKNPGDVLSWITDQEGNLRARIRKTTEEERILEVLYHPHNIWKNIIMWDLEDSVHFLSFTHDNKGMWMMSNRGRDRISLVRLDLETGKETLIYEDPQVDLGKVPLSYLKKEPLLATSYPDYQRLHFFDSELEADLNVFREHEPMGMSLNSWDNRERLLTISVFTDKGSYDYLFNRDTRKKILLGRDPIFSYIDFLSTVQPISFKSRDGLTLHGYLTLPKGTYEKRLPMVLLVHGGPWVRDYWAYKNNKYKGTVQFLANRGYAVLQINYRGSSGYGRAFEEAAVDEFAGKMHTDLVDGVKWAIERGIADPQRIGIFGASYGGYATLVGLTFTPDIFACGVDMFGMSNLVSFSESVPEYWKPWMAYWYKYVGNPDNPDDRRKMKARSPLFRVDQIKRPLLIMQGAKDPRVKQQESDQIVSALKKAGREVEYILFPDEGHGIGQWKNRLLFYRKVEDFLAKHLGGRSAGFDFFELGFLIF